MALCWHCRANLPEEAKYCSQCGQKQEMRLSVSPISVSDTVPKSHEKEKALQEPLSHTEQRDEIVTSPGSNGANFRSKCQDGREMISLLKQSSEQRERGMTEYERQAPLLLRPELHKQLLEWLRHDDYEQLATIREELASDVQSRAASALTCVLRDRVFDTLLPPSAAFGNREPNQFARAKELINKEDAADREKGLELLKKLKASRAFNTHPAVEEWSLFAEALVHGLGQAIPEWQTKRAKGKASGEDIWNLAVFYARQSDFKQALEVLRSGFEAHGRDRTHGSFTHLRFALYCAAQLLGQEPEANRTAVAFLRRHLNKWPEPTCFLVWMLLEEQEGQCQGADHQVEQIKMWRTLHTLLDRPILIPELHTRPGEREVRGFMNQLQQLGFHETVILWLNDYTRCSATKLERLDSEMRQALLKAYEAIGEIELAGGVLYKVALEQCSKFQRQRGSDGAVPDRALFYMRKALVELFAFYKRHSRLERKDVFERFERLHREAPELWSNTVEGNKQLLTLTRPLLEQVTQPHSELKRSPQPARVQPAEKKAPLSVEVARPDQPLSHRTSETMLPLRIAHRGPGEARDIVIRVTGVQSEQKALVSRRDERLDGLKQGETRIVAIPVVFNPVPGQEWLECRVDLVYRWDGEKRSTSHPLKVRSREARKQVGLFVDYENVFPSARGRGALEVGNALITYASRFGEVACCWAIAHPQNMTSTSFKTNLEQAGFKVRFPHDEPQGGRVPKNASDNALIAQIFAELLKTQPDFYIIVSGDGDYYEIIRALLDSGKTVRLCASLRPPRLAESYRELERKRRSQRQAEKLESDFFIDDLDTVLQVLGQKEAGAMQL